MQVVFDRGWAATGSKFVVAVVDWQCTLPELNDDEYQNNNENNTGYTWVNVVTELPDLAIQNVTYEPVSISAGESITLSVTVKNVGDAAVPAASALGVFVDEAFEACVTTDPAGGWTAVPALAVDESTVLSIVAPANAFDPTWTTGHDIYLFENYRCTGVEWNNANNGYGPITISALRPDLAIESMTIAPTSIHAREAVTYTLRISNRGTGPSTAVQLGISSTEYPDRCDETTWDFAPATVPALAAGASTVLTLPARRMAGARREVGLCDPRHGVRAVGHDSNGNNNRFGPLKV